MDSVRSGAWTAAIVGVGLEAGCGGGPPTELRGTWEIVGIVADGQIQARDQVGVAGVPGATWGREIWKFARGQVTVERDVLLPNVEGGYTACEVEVTVSAAWKGDTLTVPYGARARSRARSKDDGEGDLASCDVSIDAGDWKLAYARGEAWESLLENPATGGQLRLKQTNDNPDYRSRVPDPAPLAAKTPGGP